MKQKMFLLASILLISALALSACGSKANQSGQSNKTEATPAAGKTEDKTVSDSAIKEGTANCLRNSRNI